jgi:glycosyltransferase involved in cell wall biosynthesis
LAGGRSAAEERRISLSSEHLELLLPVVKEEVAGLGLTADIVVVDGGSHDATRAAAEGRGARTVVQQERGYGALLTGFAATTAPYIVINRDHGRGSDYDARAFDSRPWRRGFVLSCMIAGGSETWLK